MKKAFTLAEILITLGIVGTVAALTIPALVKHSGAAEVGPRLAKFVNTFENGTSNLLQARHKSKISDLTMDSAKFLELLSSQIVMSPAPDDATYYIYAVSEPEQSRAKSYGYRIFSNELDAFFGEDGNVYILKDGSSVYYTSYGEAREGRGSYKGIVGELFYDINGNSGTNYAGKEVFKFFVDNSGELIPYGSNADEYVNNTTRAECGFVEFESLNSCAPAHTLNPDADRRSYGVCAGLKMLASSSRIKDAAYSCTGKIADNGWKSD